MKWYEHVTEVAELPKSGMFKPDCCVVHVSESRSSTRTKRLESKEVTIGRSPDCGLVILSAHISRLHARLLQGEDGEWRIVDAGSANGIRLNGKVVTDAPLTFGDRIELGCGEVLLFRAYDHNYQIALEAQKLEALGRLASGIAHDFNNVLMAIVGATTTVLEEGGYQEGNSEQERVVQEALEDILSASDRGAELASQLLSFARHRENERGQVGIHELIETVSRLIRRTFDQNIQLETQIDSQAVVMANPGPLYQVLMNLCINARDAMPNGGTLRIDVDESVPSGMSRPGKCVCIKVSDTGCGMSASVRARMFEPFFSTKGEGQGTGLGMATTYGIVTSYAGTVEVDSEEGVGTTVSVYLPAIHNAELQSDVQSPTEGGWTPSVRGTGRTVLLAEDQPLIRRHTARVLRRLGFDVLEAENGIEAVTVANEFPGAISLALVDLQMPKRSGDQVCRELHASDPQLPVVMVSGNVRDPRIEELAQTDDIGVLAKPFSLSELVMVLQDAR